MGERRGERDVTPFIFPATSGDPRRQYHCYFIIIMPGIEVLCLFIFDECMNYSKLWKNIALLVSI